VIAVTKLALENPMFERGEIAKLRETTRMRPTRVLSLIAAELFALFLVAGLAAQTPALVTLIKAGRLLDPRTGNVLSLQPS
jgi:hypothetical protein